MKRKQNLTLPEWARRAYQEHRDSRIGSVLDLPHMPLNQITELYRRLQQLKHDND